MRKKPDTAEMVQEGLWADLIILKVKDKTFKKYNLYSSEGYCFYEKREDAEDKIYYEYMSSGYQSIEQINENVVSISKRDEYEIA